MEINNVQLDLTTGLDYLTITPSVLNISFMTVQDMLETFAFTGHFDFS